MLSRCQETQLKPFFGWSVEAENYLGVANLLNKKEEF